MTELSNAVVVSIGLGTVFIGLICIILLCYIMSAVCRLFEKNAPVSVQSAPAATANTAAPIGNKQEILAACCAVIAEEIGTEANNIKVVSFKRV